MKHITVACISLMLIACNKYPDEDRSPLTGTWKMVKVEDVNTSQIYLKPNDLKDVVIEISGSERGGTITGTTTANTIAPSEYTLGDNQSISIPGISATQVFEPQWGSFLLDNMPFAKRYELVRALRLRIFTDDVVLEFSRQ